ncbi:MAG: DUF3142 domain-containing protein [Kofleriaceae bacterium]|nr:DUF3142 domain-containing protein [Kofleriaceae bacterium]
MIGRILLFAFIGLLGCSQRNSDAPPLSHEAYVWQRNWTVPVQEAVVHLPPEISGLRVLALEISEKGSGMAWPKVNLEALTRSQQAVTVVVRINGSRIPSDFSLATLLTKVESWQTAGVNVVGIEVDHDSATAGLADYAAWLRTARPPKPLRFSITTLPTWMKSSNIKKISQHVDEMVLQVHAIRAPRIFDAKQARIWIHQFSRSLGSRPFRIALPTYEVELDGAIQSADPKEIQSLLGQLKQHRPKGPRGVVWFRMPVQNDTRAWSASTLSAVISNKRLASDVQATLVPDGPLLFNVVIENRGNLDENWPQLKLTGTIEAVDLTMGYVRDKSGWVAPKRRLVSGEKRIVGWVRGENVAIDVD